MSISNVLVLAVLLVILTAFAVWFLMRPKPGSALAPVAATTPAVAAAAHGGMEVLTVRDPQGAVVLQSSEIAAIPSYARRIDPSNPLVGKAAHLVSDIFKGAASIPGKSISLVFKPEIQAGLKTGEYVMMTTKTGETLADAVDASNKIVGKARVVEGGKLKQLASGGFQLASIVVAQSHLADIEQSLNKLRAGLEQIQDDLEASHTAAITGRSRYLGSLIAKIQQRTGTPDNLLQHEAAAIQQAVKESYILLEKLHEDLTALTRRVNQQTDPDTFGTEGAHKALRDHLDKADSLLLRHQNLIHMVATVNYVSTYIDPTQQTFLHIDLEKDDWKNRFGELNTAFSNRADALLGNAHFNSADTLALRKKDILRDARNVHRQAVEQQVSYESAMKALATNVDRHFGLGADTHVALTFDAHGNVKEAAVL